jgi:hypothetical protein|tara:strand:- start:774 stop:1661 length:888 start_codon:yes stop_codon:yes gene_type:complete
MLNSLQDKRRKKMMLEQGNPELNVGDPGVKRQRKALGNPDFDFSETREGVRRIQNDSKENSKEDTDSLTAFANGWMEVIRQAFADEDPLFKEQRASLEGGVPDYYKGIDINAAFDSKEAQDKRSKEVDQNRATGENLPSFIIQGSKFREALSGVEAKNYRTLFGNAEEKKTPFKDLDITTMPMKDIFDLVKKNGKFHRFNLAKGKDTTAIGKYQMVGNTLRDLKDRGILKDLGIDDDTLFDENTQDKIAVHLAERRVRPKFSIAEARKEMRDEWQGFDRLSDKELDAIINEVRGG